MKRPPRFHVARYRVDGQHFIGWIDDDRLVRLDAPPWEGGAETGDRDRLDEVRLEAPVRPSKIVCVGLNYRAHIAESLSVSPFTRQRTFNRSGERPTVIHGPSGANVSKPLARVHWPSCF